MSEQTTILFAGGGTGGHIFPSLAVIEAIRLRRDDLRFHVACSVKPLDHEILQGEGIEHTPLPVRGFTGRPWHWPGFIRRLLTSQGRAARLIDDRNVAMVVAMGGYVAGPVAMAARRRGVPVLLVNLDAVAGRAIRALSRRAEMVLSVYEEPGFNRPYRKIGFPVRQAAIADRDRAACRGQLGLKPDRPVLLVTGASLGAQTINEAMADLLSRDAAASLLNDWQVLHIAGKANARQVEVAMADALIPVKVLPFLERMGLAWGAAELAISRCGAGSTAEVLANAVPTVFLPYPYHADEHQRHNAEPLAAAGGAVILKDTTEAAANADQLLTALVPLLHTQGKLEAMRAALADKQSITGNGACQIADAVLQRL